MKKTLLVVFVLVLSLFAVQTSYEITLQRGRAEYDKANYAQIKEYWDTCPELAGLKSSNGCSQAAPVSDNMVLIKGGTFTMGDLLGEGKPNEKPLHSVTLSDFYLGKTEVTFEDFDAFCSDTGQEKPSDVGWGRGKHPVINVDWYDAVEYCNWRSQKEKKSLAYTIDKSRRDPNNFSNEDQKKWLIRRVATANGYRLPTEAEWEYAARDGGKETRFGNGKDIADPAEMNFDATRAYKRDYSVVGEYRGKTVEVASLGSPNTLGLYDLSGNVWEWCSDWYGIYPTFADTNPVGAVTGLYVVQRGGNWSKSSLCCRATYRHIGMPTARDGHAGFRVAASSQ